MLNGFAFSASKVRTCSSWGPGSSFRIFLPLWARVTPAPAPDIIPTEKCCWSVNGSSWLQAARVRTTLKPLWATTGKTKIGLGVFRMGVPESAQNSKCGSIQTQHDFPHLPCEEEMFLNSSQTCQIILKIVFQIISKIILQIKFDMILVKFGVL